MGEPPGQPRLVSTKTQTLGWPGSVEDPRPSGCFAKRSGGGSIELLGGSDWATATIRATGCEFDNWHCVGEPADCRVDVARRFANEQGAELSKGCGVVCRIVAKVDLGLFATDRPGDRWEVPGRDRELDGRLRQQIAVPVGLGAPGGDDDEGASLRIKVNDLNDGSPDGSRSAATMLKEEKALAQEAAQAQSVKEQRSAKAEPKEPLGIRDSDGGLIVFLGMRLGHSLYPKGTKETPNGLEMSRPASPKLVSR